MKKDRRPFEPERGTIYMNHGGGTFRCLTAPRRCFIGIAAMMQNTKSGWTFEARGIHTYDDGSIDWDYSTGGHYEVIKA